MKRKVFAVYDDKAGAYLQPFFMNSVGEATRAFSDACNDTSHAFFRHSADYTLYDIGEYDEELGMLVPRQPEPIVRASAFAAERAISESFPARNLSVKGSVNAHASK